MDKAKVIKLLRIAFVTAAVMATGPAMAVFPRSCWPFC